MPYDAVRHFVNKDIDYGFSFGLDLKDPGELHFDCFIIVKTQWLGGEEWKAIYLIKERQEQLAEYFEFFDDEEENVRSWETDDIYKATPILSGSVEWTSKIELSLIARGLYFKDQEQALEFGKLMERACDLASEIMPDYRGD